MGNKSLLSVGGWLFLCFVLGNKKCFAGEVGGSNVNVNSPRARWEIASRSELAARVGICDTALIGANSRTLISVIGGHVLNRINSGT